MKIYFTSDWHCFHKNVIEFDQRPFRDLDHMHEVLIANYNASVQPNDVCYFLGDMILGSTSEGRKIISRLNGTKILILGNHDKGPVAMKSAGFDACLNTGSIVIANQVITMSHCPLRGVFREDCTNMRRYVEGDNWHGESGLTRYSVENQGQFHLHGHTHKKPEEKILNRQWDVGVSANGYRPVSASEIEKWIINTLSKEKQ